MSRIKVMIFEDDRPLAGDIKESLEDLGYLVCAVAYTLNEALELVDISKPDLLVVDLMIGDEPSGITFAKKVNKHSTSKTPIIFLTWIREQSLFEKAKRTAPSSYLLKPFNDLELQYAIELALEKHKKASPQDGTCNLVSENFQEHIFIKRGNHLEKLSYKDIHFIEVEKKDCEINTNKGKFVIQLSLKEILTKLPQEFRQVHRNFIVNANHIIKFNIKENYLMMPNEKIINVSLRQKDKLMSFINRL